MTFGETVKVPIHYTPKEKYIEMVAVSADHDDGYETMVTLPSFGFEMSSIDYDSMRMLNPMSKIRDIADSNGTYMYNRVPYLFTFMLYLATRKFEDSLKIVEQIIPFFTPELNISIRDKSDFGIATDVPFVLNNAGFTIDWQGGFETRRTVMWTLDFSAKAFLYSNVREQTRIKETILRMEDADFNTVFESFVNTVDPRQANRNDPHTIIERIYDGAPPVHLNFDIATGQSAATGQDSSTPYSVMPLMPLAHGQLARIVESLYTGSNTFDLNMLDGDRGSIQSID